MSAIDISTSQNVTIYYQPASVGLRIVAKILDVLIRFGYLIMISLIYSAFDASSDGAVATYFFTLLPFFFYHLLFEIFMGGQSPGKRIMKIKVVKLDGTQAGFGPYVVRWLFSILNAIAFTFWIDIVIMAVNQKGQRLGDILAGTTVIMVYDRVSLRDTVYEKVKVNHQVTYNEAKLLSSSDVEIIKKVLFNVDYRNNYDMVLALANKIESKMGVDRTEHPDVFLQIVVKDYNYLCDE